MKKKVLLAAGSLALVGTIAVGGTLAYLSSITETKKNVFTSSKLIRGELTETEWNEESGSSYYPGKVIAKNPQIVNYAEDKSIDAYVAVTVKFTDKTNGANTQLSYDDFTKYAEVDFDTTNWELISDAEDKTRVYMYKEVLKAGNTTAPVFNKVTINTGIKCVFEKKTESEKVYKEVDKDTEGAVVKDGKYYVLVDENSVTVNSEDHYVIIDGDEVKGDTELVLPTFDIDVQGYMVQGTDNVSLEVAKTELLKMVENNK